MNDTTRPYYTVGSEVFYSKTLALIAATKLGITPNWHFGDAQWSQVTWQTGHTADIREVYKSRAQHLRDKYDYLILSYSGGSDSWTVLHTFLSAGIKIDELLIRWPVKYIENKYTVSTDKDPANLLSEWELTIKPDIEWLRINHPEIKLTIHDWSDDADSEITEHELTSINDHLNPGVFKKFLISTSTELDMVDAGKKVAVIWGIDRPQLLFKDGHLYLYFLDKLANTRFISGTDNRTSELFYWAPDFTELVQAQARVMYEYFALHPDSLALLQYGKTDVSGKRKYDNLARSLLYPDWDYSRFQANKPSSTVYCENDAWMFSENGPMGGKNNRYMQSWKSELSNITSSVDSRFCQRLPNGEFNGWVGMVSPLYDLGPIYQS